MSNLFEGTDLGLMYIAEQASPDENSVNNLSFTEKMGAVFCEFDTILHTFRNLNRNRRQYLGENVQERLNDEKIQCLLRDNAWFGEQDHPLQMNVNDKLTPERVRSIYLPNRSHKIMKPKISGDVLSATIQTASGTDAGRGFAFEILQGLIPCFSCRSIAGLKMINGVPTVIIQKLITYDWVLYPSHKEATKTNEPKYVNKQAKMFIESSFGEFNGKAQETCTEDVMIPLQEILEYVGKKDVNTQMIMESFELDMDCLTGFDRTFEHAIIKDSDNVIYVNISPTTKREVRNFLSSF